MQILWNQDRLEWAGPAGVGAGARDGFVWRGAAGGGTGIDGAGQEGRREKDGIDSFWLTSFELKMIS